MAACNRLFYGGDYNPDQWLDRPDILEKDIEMMKAAGINEVSVGIFAWAKLEPEDGKYSFDWLEKIITRLHENGIDSILATPSGARPHWLAEKYPSVLRTNAERQKDIFSGRHNHCLTSPDYRRKVHDIDLRLARRFAGHPAIIGWHISNEFSGECHCALCQQAFRQYLKEKYGTIEALNHAWYRFLEPYIRFVRPGGQSRNPDPRAPRMGGKMVRGNRNDRAPPGLEAFHYRSVLFLHPERSGRPAGRRRDAAGNHKL